MQKFATSDSNDLWQHRWDESTKGQWMYTLISKIRMWLEGKMGRPTTTLLGSSRDAVLTTGSICIALGWMVYRNVLDVVAYRWIQSVCCLTATVPI